MDFLYYETATGGHTGVLAAYNIPEVYDWMFSHTTAVPEPSAFLMLMIGGMGTAGIMRRKFPRINGMRSDCDEIWHGLRINQHPPATDDSYENEDS